MIDLQNISKYFGPQTILENASFRINTGEHAGIVGPNGSGKSTVAAIISGETSPDRGLVNLPRRATIGFLHQQVPAAQSQTPLLQFAESGVITLAEMDSKIQDLTEELRTARDQKTKDSLLEALGTLQTAFEQNGGYDLRHRTEAALAGLGFAEPEFKHPMHKFSGGWQMRAALARCLVGQPDILLLDEPSNYLDLPAVEWLQRYLREFSGTLILISHERYLLNTLCSVIIEIANGQAERYKGNYDHYLKERATRLESRLAASQSQDRKLAQTERFIERFQAKASKASQVKSRIKMIERMEMVEIPRQIVSRGTIRIPPPPRCGQEVVQLQDIGFSYNGAHWVLRHLDLRIGHGEKLALVGHNGMGKTTLLRILAGLLKPTCGQLRLGHNVVRGYQSQEFTETMRPELSVFETVKSAAVECREQVVRDLLGGFGFSGQSMEKKVAVLSGGEKVRLAFARLLVNPPNLLLLDEPTTHLDIGAREMLETALGQYQGTLCLVSHDVTFVENVADGIIAMKPPGILRFHGGYADYRERILSPVDNQLDHRETGSAQPSGSTPPADSSDKKLIRRQRALERQARAGQVRKLKREIARSEQQIDRLATEQQQILDLLADPAKQPDFAETNLRLKQIQEQTLEFTRRWEQAGEELEAIDPASPK